MNLFPTDLRVKEKGRHLPLWARKWKNNLLSVRWMRWGCFLFLIVVFGLLVQKPHSIPSQLGASSHLAAFQTPDFKWEECEGAIQYYMSQDPTLSYIEAQEKVFNEAFEWVSILGVAHTMRGQALSKRMPKCPMSWRQVVSAKSKIDNLGGQTEALREQIAQMVEDLKDMSDRAVRSEKAIEELHLSSEKRRNNGLETLWTCENFIQRDVYNRSVPRITTEFHHLSDRAICRFENMCVFNGKFQIIRSQNISSDEPWLWKINFAAGEVLALNIVDDVQSWFGERQVTWMGPSDEAEFNVTGVPVIFNHNYFDNTYHWMEGISTFIHAVRKGIVTPEDLTHVISVQQKFHTSIWDWAKSTLEAVMKRSLNVCDSPSDCEAMRPQLDGVLAMEASALLEFTEETPLCFKKSVAVGSFRNKGFFVDQDDLTFFREEVYKYMDLPVPTSLPASALPSIESLGRSVEKRSRLPPGHITIAVRSASRKITNLNEVEDFIRCLGLSYSVVDFSSLTFKEQVETMAKTGVLVGMHGADLVNGMFLPPGAVLVELKPYLCTKSLYDQLARQAGLHFLEWMNSQRDLASFNEPFPKYNFDYDRYPDDAPECLRDAPNDCFYPRIYADTRVPLDILATLFRDAFLLVGLSDVNDEVGVQTTLDEQLKICQGPPRSESPLPAPDWAEEWASQSNKPRFHDWRS